jgi:translation elongation factor EF-Ts
VSDGLADLVGKIRESISFRRASKAAAFPGIVGAYVHGALPTNPSLGTSAAVVVIGTGGHGRCPLISTDLLFVEVV